MSGGPGPGPDTGAPAAVVPAAAPAAAPAPVPAAAPAPAPAPAAAPIASPAPAATAAPESATSPAAAPATAPVPAPEAAPAPSAADAAKPAAQTSLLSEPKPAEAAPAADGTPAAEAAPVVLPSYEFKMPEGFEAAPEQLGKFNELIGQFEHSTGGDHVKFAEFGQKAIEFHVGELQRVAEMAEQQSRESWEVMRDGWRTAFKADADLGGAREQATLTQCAGMIDQFGGNAQQRAELRQYLAITGMGDHPALIRLLSNVAKTLGEPNPVPAPPSTGPKPSRATKRYANTHNGAA